tara:strand:+ start:8118 stop:8717 length:600 start_codon:yes stop_codon:yes gene_type:complete
MSDLIYKCSKPVFVHHLKNLSVMLKKTAKNAKQRGIDPAVLLNSRLTPDMFPLARQVQIATDHAKGCCARLAGVESPVFADTETTFAELDDRIKHTLKFLAGLKASQFAGAETRDIILKLPIGTLSFAGSSYLNGWALPNFYFHYSAAYNILRHNGVGLGKGDYLGVMPGVEMTGKIAKMMGVKPTVKKNAKSPKKSKA